MMFKPKSTLNSYSKSAASTFLTSNHFCISTMVKDKHTKALHFMETADPAACCYGFDAKPKICTCYHNLFAGRLAENDPKSFFSSKSKTLWHDVVKEEDNADVVKEKVITFLKPHHVLCSGKKVFFGFDIEHSETKSVEKFELCLPTTCSLLGITCHIGQEMKAALISKEEVATQVIAKSTQIWKTNHHFYKYFGKEIICVISSQQKAVGVVEKSWVA